MHAEYIRAVPCPRIPITAIRKIHTRLSILLILTSSHVPVDLCSLQAVQGFYWFVASFKYLIRQNIPAKGKFSRLQENTFHAERFMPFAITAL